MGHLKPNRNLEYNNYWQKQLRNTLKNFNRNKWECSNDRHQRKKRKFVKFDWYIAPIIFHKSKKNVT